VNRRGSVFFVVGQDIIINGYCENTIYFSWADTESASSNEWECFLAGQTIYLEENQLSKKMLFMGASTIIKRVQSIGDLSSSS